MLAGRLSEAAKYPNTPLVSPLSPGDALPHPPTAPSWTGVYGAQGDAVWVLCSAGVSEGSLKPKGTPSQGIQTASSRFPNQNPPPVDEFCILQLPEVRLDGHGFWAFGGAKKWAKNGLE